MFFVNGLSKLKTARSFRLLLVLSVCPFLMTCADVDVPGSRNVNIPSPAVAEKRPDAINEKPDSVLYLPLGSDVLIPEVDEGSPLPQDQIGPFELRSETLAGALQLILADYEIPLAFETDLAMTRTVTVANLYGPLDKVVDKVCSLADLYCSYEDDVMVIKETQTFTVSIPPVGGDTDFIGSIATGLEAITGITPITETGTRTIIYEATNRTSKLAERYFQKMRASTALIVFEIYIWEVALNNVNDMGIDWEAIQNIGAWKTGISFSGSVGAGSSPISIGLPTRNDVTFGANDVLQFISNYGAVKTISQPQITVLSGAQASLRAARTQNYVSSLSRSVDEGEVTVSTETDSVDTGFTMTIASVWDNSTIYGTINIELQEFLRFQDFDADGTTLQLPETTERELSSQIRIRPGDSLLIAGLVRESDQFDKDGLGFKEPIIPVARRGTTDNSELVFMLKPRVIVYTSEDSRKNHNTDVEQKMFSDTPATPAPVSEGYKPLMGTVPADALNPGQ